MKKFTSRLSIDKKIDSFNLKSINIITPTLSGKDIVSKNSFPQKKTITFNISDLPENLNKQTASKNIITKDSDDLMSTVTQLDTVTSNYPLRKISVATNYDGIQTSPFNTHNLALDNSLKSINKKLLYDRRKSYRACESYSKLDIILPKLNNNLAYDKVSESTQSDLSEMINDVINEKEIVKKYLISPKLEQNKLKPQIKLSKTKQINLTSLLNDKKTIYNKNKDYLFKLQRIEGKNLYKNSNLNKRTTLPFGVKLLQSPLKLKTNVINTDIKFSSFSPVKQSIFLLK